MPASFMRLGLFGRAFLLLTLLMLVSLAAWLLVLFGLEQEPHAAQMGQHVVISTSVTKTALRHSRADERSKILLDLVTNEGIQVYPRKPSDVTEPMPNERYWQLVAAPIRARYGTDTQIAWSVNQVPGFWVSFQIGNEDYWLAFERGQISLTGGIKWLGWGATSLLLSLIGAAVSVGFVNRPLSQLSRAAMMLSHGQTPPPLVENAGPSEIRALNTSFNRMARDIRQTEADRDLMLAGISHDLRTPLARMRLEIEMSDISNAARQAIDKDLAQIDHSINQLMEYARPAGATPLLATNISATLEDLCERERNHTASLGGVLTIRLEHDLYAHIDPLDVKRIISNLIGNARHHGRSTDGSLVIELRLFADDGMLFIEVSDHGPGMPPKEVPRLMRPFSCGEQARTGGARTGLGLSIVERLLAQVGGSLSLFNRDGGGLTARIKLPSAAFRPVPAHERHPSRLGPSRRICPQHIQNISPNFPAHRKKT